MALKSGMKTSIKKAKVKSKTVVTAPTELTKALREARPVNVSRVVQQHAKMMGKG